MTIGIAIITCDREKMLHECVESIYSTHKNTYNRLIIVNDGEHPVKSRLVDHVVNNETNLGVGATKNVAISNLFDNDCEHLFIVEDDVKFISTSTIHDYIKLSELSGVKHLNFCLHGSANLNQGKPAPKLIIDYKDIKMALYHNVTGAVSYYHRSVIDECGLMDMEYRNAMEHVDHTMRVIKAGFHPPFRWFADVYHADRLIGDQDPSLGSSKIRNEQEWRDNFAHGVKLFHERYGINVCSVNQTNDTREQVLKYLKSIKP